MNGAKCKWRSALLITYLMLLLAGCALNTYRMHPEFGVRAGSIRKSVLITPDIRIYELSSVGVAILRDDWSEVGRNNLENAILSELKGKSCKVELAQLDTQTAEEMEAVQALYRLVHKTMKQKTFGHHQNRVDNAEFNFSVGSLETILQKLDADAMIFVTGYDQVSNGGHKALIDLAVADSSGTILYYSVKGTRKGEDLRNPVSAAAMTRDLLSGFSRMNG